MEPNIPLRQIYSSRIIPMLRDGHRIEWADGHDRNELALQQDGRLVHFSNGVVHHATHNHLDMFRFFTDSMYIMSQRSSKGVLMIDGKGWLPLDSIDSYSPKLVDNSDHVYKSWNKSCV
jgi:hypothetical protein